MPIIDDPRATESAITGPVNDAAFQPTPVAEPSPGVGEVLSSAAREATLAGAGVQRYVNFPDFGADEKPSPNWDALDHINEFPRFEGWERYAAQLADARSPAELRGRLARIQASENDRDVLRRAGLGSPVATIALNLIDPSFLVAAAVPELGIAKATRMGQALSVARQGAAGATAYEVGMNAVQENRTLEESGFNIAGGALLGGVLGSLGRRVPKAEMDALRASVHLDVTADPIRSEVGAASAASQTTLAQESLARGGQTFAKLAGKVPFAQTDLQVVLNSDSHAARTILQELADVTPVLAKNTEGIATPTSVESMVGRQEGRVADFADHLNGQWAKYKARLKAAEGTDFPLPNDERLSREEFYRAVASASRRGDKDLVPEVAEAAAHLRGRVFDPLKVEAQRLGLLPHDVEVVGAESYFRRMYDREAIRANRKEWDNIIRNHFVSKGASVPEATSATEDVTRHILGADVGQANFNIRIPIAGPLHERVLAIDDAQIERYLVNDPVKVAHAYTRELSPQIEMTKRFGDKDMLHAFDKVREEYDVLRERVRSHEQGSSAQISELQTQERDTLQALTRIRDRVYGRAGRLPVTASENQRTAVKLARDWRNVVASGRLGVTAITGGLMDTARIAATYGFLPTMAKLTKLVASPAFRNLSMANARRLGAAVEATLARRVNVAYDGAATEGWSHTLAQGVYKYTGLNHVTDFNRTLAATLIEDELIKVAGDVSAGRTVDAFARTRLASLGIDENAFHRIHREVLKHGGEVDGVRTSGSANWDDAALATRYDTAILKEARVLVMQPGAADRVWWADSDLGKVIGQLKTFSISTPMRMTITPIQMLGHGRPIAAARFMGAMLIGGFLTHVLRQFVAGKTPTTDPLQAANEAFTEAGLAGIVPDLVAPLARRFGLFGESSKFSDRNVLSTFGGPALGTLGDAYDLSMNRTQNGMSARDLQLLRRLMPYQNLWWARRAINALEGETAEAMNLPGADVQSFAHRFLETKPLLPSNQRGGTGTGQLVQ